jgi:hypothetical protein
MLTTAATLKGYKLESNDGEIGKVKDFYFDDQYWTVRYLVADTGTWLSGKQVLISPYALAGVIKDDNHIRVDLSKKQIQESPSLDTDKPVSRQFEEDYYGYYGWPSYWGGPYQWGAYPFMMRDPHRWKEINEIEKAWDPICAARKTLLAITFRLSMAKSAMSRTFSSMTSGRFAISSSRLGTGGRERKCWFRRNGSSA